jgi:hypothetical protein
MDQRAEVGRLLLPLTSVREEVAYLSIVSRCCSRVLAGRKLLLLLRLRRTEQAGNELIRVVETLKVASSLTNAKALIWL